MYIAISKHIQTVDKCIRTLPVSPIYKIKIYYKRLEILLVPLNIQNGND
jgi:hypothetical protein